MERRETEKQAQILELAQKCKEQVNKIKSSGSWGGVASMSSSSIKANQKLRTKQKAAQSQQQGRAQKNPTDIDLAREH